MIRLIREVRPLSPALATAALALCLVALAPAPAEASPETLRRSFSNIMNGPFDMALAPVVGGLTLAKNLQDIDDTPGVRVAYAVPGWFWLTGLNLAGGAIRVITGTLELLPGIGLFAFEPDMDPLFDPVENAPALVEWDNPLADVESPWVYYNPLLTPFSIPPKFGLDYTSAEY